MKNDQQGERKERTLSWGAYHLNPDEINTRPESLCAYAGVPPALVPLEPSEFSLVGEAMISKVTSSSSATTAAAATAPVTAAANSSKATTAGDLNLSISSSRSTANNAG